MKSSSHFSEEQIVADNVEVFKGWTCRAMSCKGLVVKSMCQSTCFEINMKYGNNYILKIFTKGTLLQYLQSELHQGYLQLQTKVIICQGF
jgi:hypothetical protein